MYPSSTTARLVTGVIALVLTPVALGLIATGGSRWMSISARGWQFAFSGELAGATALQLAGLALIVVVIATGLWSSAGLISAGVLSLVPLACALFPALLFPLLRALPPALYPASYSLSHGPSLFVTLALGAMGWTLARMRRAPVSPSRNAALAGYLGAPLVLALSGWLLLLGLGAGQLAYMMHFRGELNPLAIGTVILGAALLVLGVMLARRAPAALVLPAVVLLVSNAVLFFSPQLVMRSLPRVEALYTAMNLSILALPTTMGVAFLAFTGVLFIARSRNRPLIPPTLDPSGSPTSAWGSSPYAPPAAPSTPDR